MDAKQKYWRVVPGVLVLLSGCLGGGLNRLNQVDSNPSTGFEIYRSGTPKEEDLKEWCRLGIKDIFALNGLAGDYQKRLGELCPSAQVVYNEEQNADAPVAAEFLQRFDEKVSKAQAEGTKILFHCSCGCHRTGRLAAYYRIKYNGWSSDAAIREMHEIGDDMDQHPSLDPQVRAMEDYIRGRPCTQAAAYCIQ